MTENEPIDLSEFILSDFIEPVEAPGRQSIKTTNLLRTKGIKVPEKSAKRHFLAEAKNDLIFSETPIRSSAFRTGKRKNHRNGN